MRTIKNLVFEGGGVLGMAYAGAIKELENQGVLSGIERVAGTSAGALMAMLVSLGYSTDQMKQIIDNTNFKNFEDHFNPLRVTTHYGLYEGEYLLQFVQKLVADITGNTQTTFQELQQRGCKELKVYACNLHTVNIEEFSAEKTPNVIVAEAVRASMSIPLFFRAWQFSQGTSTDHIYVDGGTIYNYPIDAYPLDETLGFFFVNHTNPPSDLRFDHPLKYVETVFNAVLAAQKIDFDENPAQVAVTVFIDKEGVSPTDFSLSPDKKVALYNSGMNATRAYFQAN